MKYRLYLLALCVSIGIACTQQDPALGSLELTSRLSLHKLSSNTGIFHEGSPETKGQARLQAPITSDHSTYVFESVNQGDLACYVTLLNTSTQKLEHYDSEFDWCHKPELFGQKIKVTFHKIMINDCESIEPCGRSREVVSLKSAQIVD